MYFADQTIIKDFDQFLIYLEAVDPLSLTKRMKRLKTTDLLALNAKMSTPVVVAKNRPTQKDFTGLNFFFHIVLIAELFTIRKERKDSILIAQPERMQLYHAMNADERYAFLLQSFWCYMDWDMAFDQSLSFQTGRLFPILEKGGTKTNFSFEPPAQPMTTSRLLAELLRAFGLFDYTLNTDTRWHNNSYIAITTLTLTEHGQKILSHLCQKRPMYLWRNLDPYLTKSRIERIYGPIDPKEELPLELIDFFAVFKSDFPDWKITNRLYPITPQSITGELTLKVLLTPKCYRTIRISTAVTLEDLHLAIQKVFHFDNDHLYAFFLNGVDNYRAGNVFSDPRGNVRESEYPAHLVNLGDIGLYPGKELLYLFDFGDNWQFLVQVLTIENTAELDSSSTFKLIETKGKAPRQYPKWED